MIYNIIDANKKQSTLEGKKGGLIPGKLESPVINDQIHFKKARCLCNLNHVPCYYLPNLHHAIQISTVPSKLLPVFILGKANFKILSIK